MINMNLACKPLIRELCQEVADISGDVAEIGVYRGESASEIANATADCDVHLFDTFTGFPEGVPISGLDFHSAGFFGDTSPDRVACHLGQWRERVHIHEGIFPATAFPVSLKFVHVDCDLYATTKAAMNWAWNNLVPGGVILNDDYKCGSCLGAKKACDEFMSENPDAESEVRGTRLIIRRRA